MSDTYNEYSEFIYSNWFAYWMKGFSKDKQKQLLVLWYIDNPDFGVIEYRSVKRCIEEDKVKNSIPFASKISDHDIDELYLIYESFIIDVDKNYIDIHQ